MGEPLPEFDPEFAGPAQWAAMYRACGWPVVPAWMPAEHQNFKHPKVTWRHYHAVIPQADHDAWYAKNGMHTARLNMGVLTGGPYKLLMIDLDTYKSPKALAWWREVIETENHGIEPETVRQRSGGGGQQLFFQVPADWHCPNAVTDLGVDIRCDGGFAMLPPSLHDSGNSYAWEAGFAPWEVHVDLAGQWLLDAVEALIEAHGGDVKYAAGNGATAHAASPGTGDEFTAWGKRWDHREHAMFRHVWHRVLEWAREPPGPTRPQPFPHDWEPRAREAYADYARNTDVAAQGKERGWSLYWGKWRAAMKQWGSAKMIEAAEQPAPKDELRDHAADFEEAAEQAEEKVKADPSRQRFTLLDVREIKALADPRWRVAGLMAERALGFIYGPPKNGKTFIALDIALSLATGLSAWWGRQLSGGGAIIYVASEGHAHLKFRIRAWEQNRGVVADDAPFFLLRQPINFMRGEDIGDLKALIDGAIARANCPISAVFVDTVSKVLPGAEENQQKDMTLFENACAQLRERFDCIVVGIHHTNKNGEFRGSTVIPAAADFMLEVIRHQGLLRGEIYAKNVRDGEDGWRQPFAMKKIEMNDLGSNSSLVIDGEDVVSAGQSSASQWPAKDTLHRVLLDMQQAWNDQKPWSSSPQTRERYAVRILWVRYQIEARIGRDILEQWLINQVVSVEIRDFKTKMKGLKVVGDID